MSVNARLRDAELTSECPIAVDPADTAAALLQKVHAALDLPRPIEDYNVVVAAGAAAEVRIEDCAAPLSAVGILGACEEVEVSLKLKFVAREHLRLRGIGDAKAAEAAVAAAWGQTPRGDGVWETMRLVASAGYSSLMKQLCEAATQGDLDTADKLVSAGADLNAQDNNGRPALHGAAFKGHDSVAKLLLEAGADVKAEDNNGWTALHMAATKGHDSMAKLLLEAGADVNAESKFGRPALHWAAAGGHDSMAKLLLEAGADVKAKDSYGWTALHRSAVKGRNSVAEVLLEAGADADAESRCGKTAFRFADETGHNSTAMLLREAGANAKAE